MMRYRNSRNAVVISVIIWLTVSCLSSISLKFRYIEPMTNEPMNSTGNNNVSDILKPVDVTCKSVVNLTDGEDCYW